MLFVFLGGPQLQPYIHSTTYLDLTFDFIPHPRSVGQCTMTEYWGKRAWESFPCPFFFFFSLLLVDRGLRHDRAVYTNRLRQLIAVVTAENNQVLTSVYSISVPLRPFSRLRNHILVVSFLLYSPYPRITLTLHQTPTLTISHDRALESCKPQTMQTMQARVRVFRQRCGHH